MSDCTVRLDRELVMYSYILMSHLSSIFQFLSDPVNGVSNAEVWCGKYGEKSFGETVGTKIKQFSRMVQFSARGNENGTQKQTKLRSCKM